MPGQLPAHLNLARFLSNSCFSRWKSWMYFIWGHKATREVERDVSTRERAGRYIPVDPASWAPHHPHRDSRALQPIRVVLQLPAEGFQPAQGFGGRFSPLFLHHNSPGQEGTAGLCALDLSCRWQIHPD